MFQKGDTITTNGKQYVVRETLGEGGQGTVFRVSDKRKSYAMKIYSKPVSQGFRNNLIANIDRGSPSPAFLWPQAFLDFEDGQCGYLMDLRPKNFVSFVSYLNGKTVFRDLATKIRWSIELCLAFKKLHESGYAYQDLNDGSFFLDPETGALLICDTDNVSADHFPSGILGKMRYMAPEIVRGDKDPTTKQPRMPDVHSDRFSLAIILFLAFCFGNPFEGERLKNYEFVDERAEYELFGKKPVFIYHKTDLSNRPIRGYHTAPIKYWPQLPIYIKEAFHRTFTEGLSDRENGRTTELEWLRLLSRYRDEIVSCSRCGKDYALGIAEKRPNESCPFCSTPIGRACVLRVGKNSIVLQKGKELFETHLDRFSSEYNTAVGQIIENSNRPGLYGIRMNAGRKTQIRDSVGADLIIPDGGVIPIVNNLKIQFNRDTEGEIVLWK